MTHEFLRSLTLDSNLVVGGIFSAIAGDDLPTVATLTPGTYPLANVTVDAHGRVTFAEDGTASQTLFIGERITSGPESPFVAPVLFIHPSGSDRLLWYDLSFQWDEGNVLEQYNLLLGSSALGAGAYPGLALWDSANSAWVRLKSNSRALRLTAGGTVGTDDLQFNWDGSSGWTINQPKNNGTITLSATSGGSAVINLNAAGIRISGGGTEMASISSTASDFNTYLRFPRGTPHSTPPDTGLKATASGVLRFTDGSNAGTSGGCKVYVGVPGTQANVAVGGTVFDKSTSTGNVGTGEDDLHSVTTVAGQLAADNDKLFFHWQVTTTAHATDTRRLRVYFGGTSIFDSTAQATTAADNVAVQGWLVRESSSVVRASVWLIDSGGVAFTKEAYTRVTGLTLSNTNILKITGESAGGGAVADNDVVVTMGTVKYLPAA